MDWAPVDIYCERLEPGLWAEPINALTNLAFLLAATIVWPRVRGDVAAELLALSIALIGICSGLFHTLAVGWAGAADSLSIAVFILIYLYTATTLLFGAPWWGGLLAVVAFFPYAIFATQGLTALLGPLNGSTAYVSVLLLIVLYALAAIPNHPRTGGGMIGGALVLAISIAFRSIDDAVCPSFPLGTHFLWHCLNALMLGWMVLVIHRAAPGRPAQS